MTYEAKVAVMGLVLFAVVVLLEVYLAFTLLLVEDGRRRGMRWTVWPVSFFWPVVGTVMLVHEGAEWLLTKLTTVLYGVAPSAEKTDEPHGA